MASPRARNTKKAGLPDPAQMSYEQAVEELEAIIQRIEEGEIGLEESLDAYRRGAELLKRCRAVLDAAEQQVERITAETEADEAASEAGDEAGD